LERLGSNPREVELQIAFRNQAMMDTIRDKLSEAHGTDAVEAWMDKVVALAEVCRLLPFQELPTLNLIRDLWNELADATSATFMRQPILASSYFGSSTGMTLSMQGRQVILLDEGLLGFANLFCKIIASALSYTGSREDDVIDISMDEINVKRALQDHLLDGDRLDQLFSAYIFEGTPLKAASYWPDPRSHLLSATLRDGFERFIVAHEMGHIAARDTDNAIMTAGSTDEALRQRLEDGRMCFKFRHEKECLADVFGCMQSLALALKEPMLAPLNFMGMYCYFAAADVVERLIFLLETGEEIHERPNRTAAYLGVGESHPTTHPAPAIRAWRLRDFVRNSEEMDPDLRRLLNAAGIAGQHIAEACFGTLKQSFVNARLAGRRAHPIWSELLEQSAHLAGLDPDGPRINDPITLVPL
jgi:hypothetical protein